MTLRDMGSRHDGGGLGLGLGSSEGFSNRNDSIVPGAAAVGFSSHSAFVLPAEGSALWSGCLGCPGQRLLGAESLPGVLVPPPGAKLSYFVILLYSIYLISLRSGWEDVGAGMCPQPGQEPSPGHLHGCRAPS